MDLVKSLKPDQRPYNDARGAIRIEANPASNPYIVWDEARDAPPGFGVKVAGRRKTYIVRRKVRGRSITAKVGDVADFLSLKSARVKAAELASQMVTTGVNPNVAARAASAAELTLGAAFERYRQHLSTRTQRPATRETLKTLNNAVNRFKKLGWLQRKVREFDIHDIEAKFHETHKVHPTATEQAFRFAHTAVKWCINTDMLQASVQGKIPGPSINPFVILSLNKAYRSRAQIEQEREEQAKRNPLTLSENLGPFLEAAWAHRTVNDGATGVDYLLLMVLWGCRASEHAACRWGELLEEEGPPGIGRRTTSHVWLREDGDYGPYLFLYRTKNGRNHRLPIAPLALELLRRRQQACAEEVVRRGFESKSRTFVFPAKSRLSNTGHYRDGTELLDRIREQAGIARLSRHDLRRTFGRVMTHLSIEENVKRRFLNHADVHVTDRYTQAEWQLLRDRMARIEQAILTTAPNVYNALKPLDWPPLPAVREPFQWPAAKPRSGRPRKVSASDTADAQAGA
jgi:integrase